MKKVLVVLVVLVLSASTSLVAQNPEFSKGNLIVGPRIGLGYFGSALGFGLSGEYGVIPQLGVTGALGYSGYSFSSFYNYSNFIVTVGANYHFDLLKVSKLDTYAGLSLGYNFWSWSYVGPGSQPIFDGTSVGGFIWGFTLGGRYYFSNNIAGVLELGYGLGYLRIGVDFKL
jgi:hypothetical protein